MALPIRLRPQFNQAMIMEKKAIKKIACHGLSSLVQLARPFNNHLTGGEQARM